MAALKETWESLADVCEELSSTEWALPTECPGWDVKDQLSHLIGIELLGAFGEAGEEAAGPGRCDQMRHPRSLGTPRRGGHWPSPKLT